VLRGKKKQKIIILIKIENHHTISSSGLVPPPALLSNHTSTRTWIIDNRTCTATPLGRDNNFMRVLTVVPPRRGGAAHGKRVETLTPSQHVPHTRSLAHTFDQTYDAHSPPQSLCVYGEFYARFSRFGHTPTDYPHLHLSPSSRPTLD